MCAGKTAVFARSEMGSEADSPSSIYLISCCYD